MEISGVRPTVSTTQIKTAQLQSPSPVETDSLQQQKVQEQNKPATASVKKSLPTLKELEMIKGQYKKQSIQSLQNKPKSVSEVRAKESTSADMKAQQAYQNASTQLNPQAYGQGYDAKL